MYGLGMKILISAAVLLGLAYACNIGGFAEFVRRYAQNYSYERNERRILVGLGVSKPKNWQEEQALIEKILHSPQAVQNHAVLFVGGFCDGVHGYLYRVLPQFRLYLAENGLDLDIYYREHDELHGIKELFTIYRKQGKKIIIVGHSWGACSVFKQFWQDSAVPIDLLISLDPVGLVRPQGKADHIQKWVNVYIDYRKAPLTVSNTVARIGQPFGKRDNAAVNIMTHYNHQQAQAMFFEYACGEIMQTIV